VWKWLIALIIVIAIFLIPVSVLADTSASVTVTATGYVVGAPGDFTLTYISDYEVGISWTKGADAVNTMVRAKYGSMPTSRTDGYRIYYGDGISASDTGVNFDESAATVYYRAWSENAGGLWEETGTSDSMESAIMTLLGILTFCGIMSFIALRSSFFGLRLIAGMSWFAFFIYFKGNPPTMIPEGSAAHTALLVVAIGFGLMIVLSGLGRGITRKQQDLNKGFEVSEEGGFGWRMPSWLKFEDEPTKKRRNTEQDLGDYRETLRRAYKTGEFGNRRRR